MLRILSWMGLTLVSVSPAVALAKTKAKLQGYDLLVPAGATIRLRAKIERKGFLNIDPDIEGARVGFEWNGRVLGSAVSNGDGVAELRVASFGTGTHRVRLVLDSAEPYATQPAWLTAAVAPRDAPILLTDLDGTLVDGGAPAPVTRGNTP